MAVLAAIAVFAFGFLYRIDHHFTGGPASAGSADTAGRVRAIRLELERVDTKDFWEIIDRGRNFEFMPPPQKEAMKRFFAWFDEKSTSGALQAVAVK